MLRPGTAGSTAAGDGVGGEEVLSGDVGEPLRREPVNLFLERLLGRQLRARDVAGPGEATPVLYMHGTPESSLTIDYQCVAGQSASPRLFSFDRPGYGMSEFSPFSFESVSMDAAAVADCLGIDRFAVVGHSGGAPFALAMGAFLGERVTAIGLSAAPVPYKDVPFAWQMLTEVDQRASAMSETDPAGAARLFSVDFEPLARTLRASAESAREYLLKSLKSDSRVLSDAATLDIFTTSLQEGIRQGVQGCSWDNVAWVGSWSFSLDDVTQPVRLWYGANDELMPKAFGEWLVARLPQGQLHVWDDCGHLGLFPHWNEVFGRAASDS